MVMITDLLNVPTKRTYTDSGQLIVPCAFARTGSQQYSAESLGLPSSQGIVSVFRDEAEVFKDTSIETFRSVPVTIDHPTMDGLPVAVTTKNSADLQVGFLEGLPVRDEDTLSGTLVITDQKAIDLIQEGTVQLSAGYTCDVVEKDGKYYQKNIRANHIAIVERGRAGSVCSIADSIQTKEEIMTKVAPLGTPAEETPVVVDAVEETPVEKVVEDSPTADKATEITVDTLTVDMDILQAKYDSSLLTIDSLKAEVKSVTDSIEDLVNERTDVISTAKDLTDKEDFSGMSVKEIKSFIVADKLSIDLTDRSDEYVQARLDILLEDSTKETPLAEAMKPAIAPVKIEDSVSPVEQARLNAEARSL